MIRGLMRPASAGAAATAMVIATVAGLLTAPNAQATQPQRELPVACRGVAFPAGNAPRDLCRALVAGDVNRMIAMCRGCEEPNLAAQVDKWRDPAYRRAMIRALRAGGAGNDMTRYPSFASYITYDSNGVAGFDLREYTARERARARRYLNVRFPKPLKTGWTPAYTGPVVAFGFTYDTPDREGRWYFAGTYDFLARTSEGTLCDWPNRDGCS